MRYAIGIVQHPITQRWQSWLYTKEDETVSLVCLSAHASRSQAHLVARIVMDAYHTNSPIDLSAMLAQSQESDIPDPLPQAMSDQLIAIIRQQTNDTTTNTIMTL